jgi:hypothetical protein
VRAPAVKTRLTALGFAENRVHSVGSGSAPVAEFAAWWRDQTSTSLLRGLSARAGDTLDDPMLVVWGKEAFAAVVTATAAGDVVTLTTDPISTSREAAAWPRDDASVLPVMADVLQFTTQGSRLEVLTPDGARQAIIGWAGGRARMGYGRAIWNVLTPSGTP